MPSIKYTKSFEEWSKDFCLNNPPDSETVFYDIESSLREWFLHHPSLHIDIEDKIKEFVADFNKLTDTEIQKDHELTIYFEIIKNGNNENEILLKLEELIQAQNTFSSYSLSNQQLLIDKSDIILEKIDSVNTNITELKNNRETTIGHL